MFSKKFYFLYLSRCLYTRYKLTRYTFSVYRRERSKFPEMGKVHGRNWRDTAMCLITSHRIEETVSSKARYWSRLFGQWSCNFDRRRLCVPILLTKLLLVTKLTILELFQAEYPVRSYRFELGKIILRSCKYSLYKYSCKYSCKYIVGASLCYMRYGTRI